MPRERSGWQDASEIVAAHERIEDYVSTHRITAAQARALAKDDIILTVPSGAPLPPVEYVPYEKRIDPRKVRRDKLERIANYKKHPGDQPREKIDSIIEV